MKSGFSFAVGTQRFSSVQALSDFYSSEEFEKKYTYDGDDLGAVCHNGETVFKLWSPAAVRAGVRMYRTGSDMEENAEFLGEFPMEQDDEHPGLWTRTFSADLSCVYYTYVLEVNGRLRETADPYASAVGINGLRSMVIDLGKEQPEGWEQDDYRFTGPSTDAIVWEVHVRDFSHSRDSGMIHQGKFLAFTEHGTTVNNEGKDPTGIDHLKKQGITHVHLLPIQSNGSVDEMAEDPTYNWGYDPLNYNAPEGSFSTDPWHGETAVRELRAAILSMHQSGIGVVLDVVYNHTFYTEASWFEQVMPYYYHRTNGDGKFGNGSGCGNETASERSMMRNFMLQSIRFFAENYHVDGFRFDLMGVHDVETVNAIRRLLNELGEKNGKRYLMYGEPWAAEPPVMKEGHMPADMQHLDLLEDNIAVFGDRFRDGVKGSAFRMEEGGFINGRSGTEAEVAEAIRAYCHEENDRLPTQIVTYVSSHDNFSLWDKLTFTMPTDGSGYDEPEMMRVAANKLAAAMILTSQGMPFFQAGEEMGRSKQGEGNSYRSPENINDIFWSRSLRFEELEEYYRGLIEIRKAFSCFRDASGEAARSIRFFRKEDRVIAYVIPGMKTGEPKWMMVAFNASGETAEMEICSDVPEEECSWQILANENFASLNSLGTIQGRNIRVFMRSALILASFSKLE